MYKKSNNPNKAGDRIIAHAPCWIGKNNVLVFDSIESKPGTCEIMLTKFFQHAAEYIVEHSSFNKINVGCHPRTTRTPKTWKEKLLDSSKVELPIGKNKLLSQDARFQSNILNRSFAATASCSIL